MRTTFLFGAVKAGDMMAHKVDGAKISHTLTADSEKVELFARSLAINADPVSAYRAAGYPDKAPNGKRLTEDTITKRAKALAREGCVQALMKRTKQDIIAKSFTEWTRDEIIDGYRKIYNLAMENIVPKAVDGDGVSVPAKFNDKAAQVASTVLERITKIYGYDAPQKVDATVNFVFGGIGNAPQAPTIDAAQSNVKTYDYTAEPEKVPENAAGEAVGDSDAEICEEVKKFAV